MFRDDFVPRVTVAAIAERDGKFLMIEETVSGKLCINQPAGHWDRGESLAEAAAREALEESGYQFTPLGLVGIYTWTRKDKDRTFVRFCFHGEVSNQRVSDKLDDGIERAIWMTRDEVATEAKKPGRIRSPMVLAGIDAYLAGTRLPLSAVSLIT